MDDSDSVARLILDSIENCNETFLAQTQMGQAFLNLYKRKVEAPDDVSEEEREFIRKVKHLKLCEDAKDLGWMDFTTWNLFTPNFQDFFEKELEPLIYDGVYFQLSILNKKQNNLWLQLPEGHSVYELSTGDVSQFVCIGPDENSFYKSMTDGKFKDHKKTFINLLVRSIGRVGSKIFVKEYKKEFPSS